MILQTQLATAKLALVLIGPTWLEALKKRLTEGPDYHHVEVATALREGELANC